MPQYCPKCGTQLLIGAKFCSRCGENVEQQTMQPIFSPQQQPASQPPAQPQTPPTQTPPPRPMPQQSVAPLQQTQQYGGASVWYQNFYRIRKKSFNSLEQVLA